MISSKWDSFFDAGSKDAGSKDSDSSVVAAPGDGYRSRMRGEVGEEGEYHLAPLWER